jgi:Tol biopolymer transport system component
MEYAPNGDTLLYAAPPPRSGGFEKHPILFALRPKTDSRPRILSGGGQGGPHRAIETIDFAIFPDGNSLLYRKKEPQNTGGLWHLNLVSGEEKALAVDGLVTDPMISRDGETIYFLVNHQEKGSQLWWFNVADQSPKKLAGEELFNDPLNWKPAEDGKSVK